MVRLGFKNWMVGGIVVVLAAAVLPVGQVQAEEDTGRAAWLMNRSHVEDMALTGVRFEQSEIGGGGDDMVEVTGLEPQNKGMKGAWPVLMSAILPGAGEVAIGYKRGYFMIAADLLAWTQVAKYHQEGEDKRDEYIAFADAHYSDELLVAAYAAGGSPFDDFYREGQGHLYIDGIDPINDVDELNNLPLYVTKDEDFREYYENLGKWDQFVFGWDDYIRPDDYPGYTPTDERGIDLQQPWVSVNREAYRVMRGESNDAYKTRDRWLYMNIGLRVVSVLQVAYLQGLLGGGPAQELEVAGHTVEIQASPTGLYRGVVSAKVSF